MVLISQATGIIWKNLPVTAFNKVDPVIAKLIFDVSPCMDHLNTDRIHGGTVTGIVFIENGVGDQD